MNPDRTTSKITKHRGRLADIVIRSGAAAAYGVSRKQEAMDALERLEEGKYGFCRDCGERIPEARLRVKPEATRCVRCQAEAERRRRS